MSNTELSCPNCFSTNTYYSKKNSQYVCEDCFCTFIPKEEKVNQIFFSYGHDENLELVKAIKKELEACGYKVWIDIEQIKPGDDWRDKIYHGILESQKVVVFLSKHSARSESVCIDELRIAICERHGRIQTVLLSNEESIFAPTNLTEIQWIDMSHWKRIKEDSNPDNFDKWYHAKIDELLHAIKSERIQQVQGEINKIQSLLSPCMFSCKEVALLKNDFFGRQWLFDDIKKQSANKESRLFFVVGKSGSGKSSIAARCQYHLESVLLTHYIMWNDLKTSSPVEFAKSFIFKLATRIHEYRSHIIAHIDCLREALDGNLVDSLFENFIIKPLQSVIDGNRAPSYIVIDGLDEGNQKLDQSIYGYITKYINAFPKFIKFIFTSSKVFPYKSFITNTNFTEYDLGEPQSIEDCKGYAAKIGGNSLDLALEGNFMLLSLMKQNGNPCAKNIDGYYYEIMKKAHFDRGFSQQEKTALSLLCQSLYPVTQDIVKLVFNDNESYYAFAEAYDFLLVNGKETFRTFWYIKTLTINHISFKDWLKTSRALEFQTTVEEQLSLVDAFYKRLLERNSKAFTKSTIRNYESFLRNNFPEQLLVLKKDYRYKLIVERANIDDDYSNHQSRISKIDADKVNRLERLSHDISFSSSVVRYHSLKPFLLRNGGAMDDYCEYYLFPCCNQVVIVDGKSPEYITESGCKTFEGKIENMPLPLEFDDDEKLSFFAKQLRMSLQAFQSRFGLCYFDAQRHGVRQFVNKDSVSVNITLIEMHGREQKITMLIDSVVSIYKNSPTAKDYKEDILKASLEDLYEVFKKNIEIA